MKINMESLPEKPDTYRVAGWPEFSELVRMYVYIDIFTLSSNDDQIVYPALSKGDIPSFCHTDENRYLVSKMQTRSRIKFGMTLESKLGSKL